MNKKQTGLLAGLVFVLSMPVAQAARITFNYLATGNGGVVSGSFGYDDTVLDVSLGDSVNGSYPSAGFLTGSVSGGLQNGFSFNKANSEVIIENDDTVFQKPGPRYNDYFAINDGSLTFIQYISILSTQPVPPLSSDELVSPLLIGSLENFTIGWTPGIELYVYDGTQQLSYSLTEVNHVPEPTILALFGLGLAAIGYKRQCSKDAAYT